MRRLQAFGLLLLIAALIGVAVGWLVLYAWPLLVDFVIVVGFFTALIAGAA